MTSLFHFEEKIHRKNLTKAEAIPLLFPRLLSQVLEHLGFPVEPHLEHRRVCKAIFTMEKWQFVSGAPFLLLKDPAKDQPPPAAPAEEPHIPASTVPTTTSPLPTSSEPLVPPVPIDSAGPSTSATPMETIPISHRDFLVIMTSIHTFATTSASFATAHAALAERMACIEAILAQTNAILAQNNPILVQIQSHKGLPKIPPSPPAAVSPSSAHPKVVVAPANPAPPTAPLDLLTAAVPSPAAHSPAVSPAAAHLAQDEDDIPPSANM